MTKKSFALFGLSILLLAACTKAEQQTVTEILVDDSAPEEGSAELEEDPEHVEEEMTAWEAQNQDSASSGTQANGQQASSGYRDYQASVLADGETKVLFFHAAWCPICKAANEDLELWYSPAYSGWSPSFVTYKVHYDNETELKSKYGVTYQHTFVKVDGQGNLIEKIQGPTDAQLQTLLGA